MAAARSEKIGYGLGDMSSSMFWKIFSYYLPFFYSNIFGLSLEHAAVLLLVTKLWDVPHQFSVEMQEEAFAWLEKQLAGG